jgi:hypothetical protein
VTEPAVLATPDSAAGDTAASDGARWVREGGTFNLPPGMGPEHLPVKWTDKLELPAVGTTPVPASEPPRMSARASKVVGFELEGTGLMARVAFGVGLLQIPLRGQHAPLTVLVFPKGAPAPKPGTADPPDAECWSALSRFLNLRALLEYDTRESEPDKADLEAARDPAEKFLLVLADPLLKWTKEVLRRHFRRHYHTEEDTLTARVRGRIRTGAHAQLALRGQAHRFPCRYEEFDFDVPDNRVLKAALRRLCAVARVVAPGCALGRVLHQQAERFVHVGESENLRQDLRRLRFHRVSSTYRHALAWAKLVLDGMGTGPASSSVPELWLDSASTFEKLAEAVTRRALSSGMTLQTQNRDRGVFEKPHGRTTRPDIVVLDSQAAAKPGGEQAPIAVGDAKYKDVLVKPEGWDQRVSTANSDGNTTTTEPEVGDWNAPPTWSEAIARVAAADSYQLYVYMRLRSCPVGFYVVPYWGAEAAGATLDRTFEFTLSPLDHDSGQSRKARVFALGLNLAAPPGAMIRNGVAQLMQGLTEPDPSPTTVAPTPATAAK